MKKLILLMILFLGMVSCNQVTEMKSEHDAMKSDSVSSCCTTKDGVFIHISSGYENPHKVLMALKMASMMAMDEDVLVYVDIKGVDLLLKTSKDLTYKDFPTLFELLDQLKEKKITVMACPTCLSVAGYKPEDLREGIIVAQKDKFFNFTKGRIITLDY